MSPGLRLDLHVHSEHSPDSEVSVSEIAHAIAEAGLNGFALTDHQSVAGHGEFARIRNVHPRLLLLRGVEVSAREGHLLVYGVSEVPARNLPIAEVIEWAHRRGGVAVLAHPFRWVHGAGYAVATTERVDGIESRNGGTHRRANERAESIATTRRIAMTGGSDAHRRDDVARAFTGFPEGVEDEAGVLESLRRGSARGAGRSLTWGGRVGLAFRHGADRAARGFRPV